MGLLTYCTQAAVPGKAFVKRSNDHAHSISELHHIVRLSTWERDDIAWWHLLLETWNGKCLFFLPTWEPAPDTSMSSDAAGQAGFAAINGTRYFFLHRCERMI